MSMQEKSFGNGGLAAMLACLLLSGIPGLATGETAAGALASGEQIGRAHV